MRSLMIVAVVISFAFAFIATAQTTDIAAKADDYMKAWADPGRFSGTVLLAKGGNIVLRKGYGMADRDGKFANTPETIFRIGSTTKMFTAFSVLQLEEKGLLNVNDPVVKYIPEMPKAWSAITIHQLLDHTSGIPDFATASSYSNFQNLQHIEAALTEYAGKPLLNSPGETLRYSNSGYILLGRIIEKVSGERYEDYVAVHILRPAGMKDTAYDNNGEGLKRHAHGYIFDGEYLVNAKPEDVRWGNSSGALQSTVDDMYRFDRLLKSGKLFSAAVTKKAFSPYAKYSAPPPFNIEADYGYGSMMGTRFGHNWIGHGGWVGGFVCDFTRYPDDDAVVIVLSNVETANVTPIARDLGAILLGAPYQKPPVHKVVHPDAKVLARYIGKYTVGPLEVDITMKNGHLYAFGTGQRVPYGMVFYSDTEFFVNDGPQEATFVADASGKAMQLIIHMDGKDIPLNRVAE